MLWLEYGLAQCTACGYHSLLLQRICLWGRSWRAFIPPFFRFGIIIWAVFYWLLLCQGLGHQLREMEIDNVVQGIAV